MSRLQRLAVSLEWPITILAVLVIPALVMEDLAVVGGVRATAMILNWIIWLAFLIEFIVRWSADGRMSYLRRAWFDLALIALTPPFGVPDAMQGIRSLRILRLLRLLRAFAVAMMALRLGKRHFRKRQFHFVVLLAIGVVILGAIGLFVLEQGLNNGIAGFGDALWWAATTVTTVGYGDVTPVTTEGRVIAVLLMITGIGVIGVFTATVASFFFEQGQETEVAQLSARLSVIEAKLDQLLERQPPNA